MDNAEFTERLREIVKNDKYYGAISDKSFWDNFSKFSQKIENYYAKTDTSKQFILDIASRKNPTHPNSSYKYRITHQDLFNMNKEYYDNVPLYHGLDAYKSNLTNNSLSRLDRIENNLSNIITNKDIELATSSTHMIGDIGVELKADTLYSNPWDMYSVVNRKTGKRSRPQAESILTEQDLFDERIEKYIENPEGFTTKWKAHDEVIATNPNVEFIWAKQKFYDENAEFVHRIAEDNGIESIKIYDNNEFELPSKEASYKTISAKDYVAINPSPSLNSEEEKISLSDETILTQEEAWEKYVTDPYDIPDEFYTSQGLDPAEQREKIDELNNGSAINDIENPANENKTVNDYISEDIPEAGNTSEVPTDAEEINESVSDAVDSFDELKDASSNPEVKEVVDEIKSQSKLNSKTLSDKGKDAISDGLHISKGGKIGIAAGLIGAAILIASGSSDKKSKARQEQQEDKQETKKNKEAYKMNLKYERQNMYNMSNSYEMQLAQSMSSYKYGKHIPGFINA